MEPSHTAGCFPLLSQVPGSSAVRVLFENSLFLHGAWNGEPMCSNGVGLHCGATVGQFGIFLSILKGLDSSGWNVTINLLGYRNCNVNGTLKSCVVWLGEVKEGTL